MGYNTGTLSNNYWDSTVKATGIGLDSGTTTTTTGLTTTQTKKVANFSNLDIANTGSSGKIWRIYENLTTPFLTSFLTPLTLTGTTNATKTYTGSAQVGTTTYTGSSQYGANTNITNVTKLGSQTNAGTYPEQYSTQQGYDISGAGILTMNPKVISLAGSRAYDGTTHVSSSIFTLSGLVSTQTLTLSGTGSIPSAHVSAGSQTVTAGTLTLGDGTNGGSASNYTLTGGTHTANISAVTLTPELSNTSVAKSYDGSTAAPTEFTPTYSFTGLIDGDTEATLSHTSALYNNAHVENADTLTVSGLSISSITGTNHSMISDYALDANSKKIPATITAVLFNANQTPQPTSAQAQLTLTPPPPLISTAVTPPLSTTIGAPSATTAAPSANNGSSATQLSKNTELSSGRSKVTKTVNGASSEGISVSLVRQSSPQQSGVITVSVPKETTTTGNGGFSFALPTQLTQSVGDTPIHVATIHGESLPNWLKFDEKTKTFATATVLPEGVFPVQIVVTIQGRSTTIVISERTQ